ncbi:MAG: iron-sulfur cluster assembly protein [Planctomycetota bacterium]|jgi:FeS assembly SUF system protein
MSEKTEKEIVAVLRTCFDPEIPVNIYDLGLIYEVKVNDESHAYVKMTLTSPACPVAGQLVGEVEAKTNAVEGVKSAEVDLVWEPPWDQSMLSEAAKLELGLG